MSNCLAESLDGCRCVLPTDHPASHLCGGDHLHFWGSAAFDSIARWRAARRG